MSVCEEAGAHQLRPYPGIAAAQTLLETEPRLPFLYFPQVCVVQISATHALRSGEIVLSGDTLAGEGLQAIPSYLDGALVSGQSDLATDCRGRLLATAIARTELTTDVVKTHDPRLGPETLLPSDHPLRTIKCFADLAVLELSPLFDEMYGADGQGHASIPPERLLNASLLFTLYSVRSERTADVA